MIDKLAKDADSLVYLPEPRYDMQLLEAMKQVIAEDPEHDLLIIRTVSPWFHLSPTIPP